MIEIALAQKPMIKQSGVIYVKLLHNKLLLELVTACTLEASRLVVITDALLNTFCLYDSVSLCVERVSHFFRRFVHYDRQLYSRLLFDSTLVYLKCDAVISCDRALSITSAWVSNLLKAKYSDAVYILSYFSLYYAAMCIFGLCIRLHVLVCCVYELSLNLPYRVIHSTF